MFKEGDTVAAVATPPGRGALAIVRLSGAAAHAITARVFRASAPPEPRRARVGDVVTPDSGEILDRAVLILYQAPASYTGEDMAEFTVHAGPAVVTGVLKALYAAGARAAEPGEFTWRAVLNGKMDVAGAQAVADLTEARTAAARTDALRRLDGELSARVNAVRENVVKARALTEAALEFGEEVSPGEILEPIVSARDAAEELSRSGRDRDALVQGAAVVIAGPRNAGKSTLFNRLLGEDRAIVAPTPGTTRDRVEAPFVASGVLFRLSDGAGLDVDTGDDVEREGMRRAREYIAEAAFVIWLEDGGAPPPRTPPPVPAVKLIRAVNKCDLTLAPGWDELITSGDVIPISAKTGAGADGLVKTLLARAQEGEQGEDGISLSARERRLLDEASASLARAAALVAAAPIDVPAAEELRLAAAALGKMMGEIDIDEVYSEVFSRFCIGK